MEQKTIIVNDSNPYKNWSIVGCKNNIAWVHLSAPLNCDTSDYNIKDDNGYDVSTLYEVDLELNQWRKINLTDTICILRDLYVSDNFLYASILMDANKDKKITNEDYHGGMKILQLDRESGEVKIIWTFDSNYNMPFIQSVIEDNYILIYLTFKNEQGEVIGRYDLLNISKNCIETVYIDNEDMVDTRIYLTKGIDGVKVLLDLHITPSDKHVSGGKSDKIMVLSN